MRETSPEACATCGELERHACGGFPTAADHLAAEACMGALLDAGGAHALDADSIRCGQCGATWEMQLPDGADRGYLRKTSPRQQRIDALAAKLRHPGS